VHTKEHNPNGFYASLIGPLMDKYCEVKGADTEVEARLMLNSDHHMERLWCSIYTLDKVYAMIEQFGGEIITIRELHKP